MLLIALPAGRQRWETAPVSEYGRTEVDIDNKDGLFQDVADTRPFADGESHTDYISEAPEGFKVTAHTPVCPVAAMENKERKLYALQPPSGSYAHGGGYEDAPCICWRCMRVLGDWQMGSFMENTIRLCVKRWETAKFSVHFPVE